MFTNQEGRIQTTNLKNNYNNNKKIWSSKHEDEKKIQIKRMIYLHD